jgi:hypothetical protein
LGRHEGMSCEEVELSVCEKIYTTSESNPTGLSEDKSLKGNYRRTCAPSEVVANSALRAFCRGTDPLLITSLASRQTHITTSTNHSLEIKCQDLLSEIYWAFHEKCTFEKPL